MTATHLRVQAVQGLLVLLMTLLSCGRAQAKQESWDWMIEPYVWAAGVNTQVNTARPVLSGQNTQSFSDLINKMDGAFQARIEGRNDRFGVFVDFTYIGLADSKDFRRLSTHTDLNTRLVDAAVSWRPGGQRYEGLDLYAGVRYLDADLSIRFDPINPVARSAALNAEREFVDALVGARYQWHLSDKWQLVLRGDVSGGSTKGTWGASLVAGYKTKNGMWLFGYRHLNAKFSSGGMDATIRMSGPQIGYGIIF